MHWQILLIFQSAQLYCLLSPFVHLFCIYFAYFDFHSSVGIKINLTRKQREKESVCGEENQ